MIRNDVFVWVLAGTVFLANPSAGCGSDSEADDFTYGESEMRVAVEGEWTGTVEIDGEKQALVVQLEQASGSQSPQGVVGPSRSTQCGSRDFVKGAAACMSMTTMPVVGSAALGSGTPATLSGSAMAFRTLDVIEVSLEAADGGRYSGRIVAGVMENGSFEHEGLGAGTFVLRR